ncbi:uncharacterized protein LOC131680550 [Topomyia yanbarensis]|uniref:uncharacterized protein LOC131680550 n=1 Tax=Topomyia yanbarensis TaxID=2498891 RepID=UPI00273BF34E|nr:uncharacterized protein LOC131680550 [Topomyia yanbarensis]
MDRLERRRSATQDQMNVIINRINGMDDTTARPEDLEAEMDSLQETWSEYRDFHNQSLDLCEDDEAARDVIEEANDLEGMYNRAKAAVREFANRIRQRPTQSPMEDILNPAPELHLPKGILPTFLGDYGEWSSFYDLFVSSVHNNHRLTKAQKLFYLKTYTTGRAAAVLKHLKVKDNAHEGALEALRKRFDRKD